MAGGFGLAFHFWNLNVQRYMPKVLIDRENLTYYTKFINKLLGVKGGYT